ncbi:hypothetical protein Pcinc_029413 [Petrolisthes cinctipes]|uniref:Uncharacterized protein n=1 Tax=Petrolisthes cinctipes TaxID=88211 RepID=A0AAE1K7J9_PETCI|nr:hypothetical protein Pcinc_029413 [Petrolisthes cinctipes]
MGSEGEGGVYQGEEGSDENGRGEERSGAKKVGGRDMREGMGVGDYHRNDCWCDNGGGDKQVSSAVWPGLALGDDGDNSCLHARGGGGGGRDGRTRLEKEGRKEGKETGGEIRKMRRDGTRLEKEGRKEKRREERLGR